MRTTRRQWLRGGAVAFACGAGARSSAPKWNPDRLGIFCHLAPEEAAARKTLAAARAAGFRTSQIQFPWTRLDASFLRSLPGWLREEGIAAEVLGAYVNACAPENVLMDCRREDFARAIDVAARIGANTLVAWTGGYGAGLMTSDPRNLAPEAAHSIRRFIEAHARRLEQAKLSLALETYITLACPDATSLRRLLDTVPKCVGAVLDPPNLTPLARYAKRDDALREMVGTLGDRVALVHLKDFRLAADGKGYDLPGPLQGEMNYSLFAEKILTLPVSPPLVAEHMRPEEFAEARRKLLPVFDAAARRLGLA